MLQHTGEIVSLGVGTSSVRTLLFDRRCWKRAKRQLYPKLFA